MKNALDPIMKMVFLIKKNVGIEIEQQSLDVTPMHFGLIRIIKKNQPCTLNDVAKMLDRDKAQITRLVNTLESQNMLSRQTNPNDKRSQFLQLEEKGEQVFEQLSEIGEQVTSRLFEGISKKDQATYEKITMQIIENLSK